MELTISINGKEVKLRDVLETLNKINAIINNTCPKCKDMKVEDKLKVIKKLINELGIK